MAQSSSNDYHEYISRSLVLVVTLLLLVWIWRFFKPRPAQHSLRSVAILVLGDIGRSPRMMYHAESCATNGFQTSIIGYPGSRPIPALERLPRVQIRYLPEPPKFLCLLPFVLMAPFKIVHQIVSILAELLINIPRAPEFIIVQNPPTIPTLALVWIVSTIRGSKVIIDWHNLGYSILALKLGREHLFVRIAKWFEQAFGRRAYAHLFVTQALHDYLSRWDLQGIKVVFHDRPQKHFHRSNVQEIHDLFIRLTPNIVSQPSIGTFLPKSFPPYSTPLTDTSSPSGRDGKRGSPIPGGPALNQSMNSVAYDSIQAPRMRRDRPALVVSSTSWTPDEDFSILLDALSAYDLRAREVVKFPKVLCIVTGKGPLKAKYMSEVAKLQKEGTWKCVRLITMWLEAEDYPTLLGSADLGVSLHSSSSALDLPMKVVDMFGCGLPVCALHFACIDELVKAGINGLVFKDAAELARQLEQLLTGFPLNRQLESLSQTISRKAEVLLVSPHASPRHSGTFDDEDEWEWCSWEENWARIVRPLMVK
ncbi:mannosyltransferase [Fistulina hepatica ATCC 64428]|uniref:Chitobiosyldiphosphodolichol beta-mannosyltransferase n=1 Tax=Fistulina hepatica ATCC 64428 TaxID=1128425 RepID=A0A0D7A2M4_9AGAR|nr:mannosyltransferase [Fistulina hepatica ATCC 64428]